MAASDAHMITLAEIFGLAAKVGLEFFGAASPDVGTDYKWFQEWIKENRFGSMSYLTKYQDIRRNVDALLPGCKTVLVFGMPYYLGDRWHRSNSVTSPPQIAQYARLADYHKVLKKKILSFQVDLESKTGPIFQWRVTVDSAPLLERAVAANTTRVFIGKNTCAIHPQKGSFYLLGELLTTWECAEKSSVQSSSSRHQSRSQQGGCGTCKRCQVHCPTNALSRDYTIDAQKCLSYWTIEHRGTIPLDYWPWVSRYIFGCDICQLVCPYNRTIEASHAAQELVKINGTPPLVEMVVMDENYYLKTFAGTPMTRAKRSGLRRNALIAGVIRELPDIVALLPKLIDDDDIVVKDTAIQAMSLIQK